MKRAGDGSAAVGMKTTARNSSAFHGRGEGGPRGILRPGRTF